MNFKQKIAKLLGITPAETEETPPSLRPTVDLRKLKEKSPGEILFTFRPAFRRKEELAEYVERLSEIHSADTLLAAVAQDLVYYGTQESSEGFVTVFYEGEASKADYVGRVIENSGLSKLLVDCSYDFLRYGEYALKYDEKAREFDDAFLYKEFYRVFSRGRLRKLLVRHGQSFEALDPHEVLVIALPGPRVRLACKDEEGNQIYVRVSRPFISPTLLDQFKSLDVLEKLAPIARLVEVMNATVISLDVPPTMGVKQAFDIAREYEEVINQPARTALSDVEGVLSMVGNYRVIPNLGGQRNLSVQEAPRLREVRIDDLQYIRRSLAQELGVPASYLTEDPNAPARLPGRYLRFIRLTRTAIAGAVRDFLLERAKADGVLLERDKLRVVLPQAVGAEETGIADYADAFGMVMNTIQTVLDSAQRILEAPPPEFDKDAFISYLNDKLRPFTERNLFKEKEEK